MEAPQVEDCIPRDDAPGMPVLSSDYAELCSRVLGQVPTADCGEGERIPIKVGGEEVFTSPANNICDNTGFKGDCSVGSTLRRQEGVSLSGTPRPEVVWVTFCRVSNDALGSVQMIGHDMETGATCFFESPDALGIGAQSEWVYFNENGELEGELPGPESEDFDRAFVSPPAPCSACHHNDPFIHNPWIDGARQAEDPSAMVLPELATANSPYWVIGGPYWDLRTPHIEGNNCVECHRVGMGTVEIFDLVGTIDVNTLMPPDNPGSESEDFAAIRAC